MRQIDLHEAESNPSRIFERVERSERIVIARAGKAVADLVPHAPGWVKFGTFAGRVTAPDDAFAWPDSDIEPMFYSDDHAPRHEYPALSVSESASVQRGESTSSGS